MGDIIKDIEKGINKLLESPNKIELTLKSCKACSFFKNGYCTQVQPPSKILNVHEAQICIYYTPETATTGVAPERPIKALEKVEQIDMMLPPVSGERLLCITDIIEDVVTTAKEIKGAGHTEYLEMRNPAQPSSEDTILMVYCDGNLAFNWNCKGLNDYGFTASTPKISLLKYLADGECVIFLTLKFEFRENLKISLMNGTADQTQIEVEGLVNLVK